MSKSEKLHATGDLTLKAFIICEHESLVARINATLQRVGCRPDVNVEWTSQSWPVNDLSRASLANSALVEAADAHLIVLPARHAHSLLFPLRDWLEQWAELRLIQDAALAVIGDELDTGFTETVSPALIHFVRKHSLNLITEDGVATMDSVKHARRLLPEREIPLPVEKSQFAYAVVYEGYRGYGINE